MSLQTLKERCRRTFAWYRAHSIARRPMKSRATQTVMTPCTSMILWKPFIDQSPLLLPPPHCRWESTADWEEADLGEMAVHWSGSQPPCSNRWRGHKWRSKRTFISCPQKKKSESHRKKKPWCGKASGPDAIHAEVYKAGGAIIMQKLAELFQFTWNEGKVPLSTAQRCRYSPHLQKEGQPPVLSQSLNISLLFINCWQDLGPHPA